jgi:hypothetical protein
MYKAKLTIHGHWIYDHDTGWKLSVYPIATMIPHPEGPNVLSSIVLAKEHLLPALGTPCDAVEKIFSAAPHEIKSLTLYNLGTFYDEDLASELEIYLVCPHGNIKDTMIHPVITEEGYMYVEDLGIGDVPEEDEPIDLYVYEALSRLEAPHHITCN